jgi:hypothetical protein
MCNCLLRLPGPSTPTAADGSSSVRKRQRELLILGLEAPPGFEPGMEVLQISSGWGCC